MQLPDPTDLRREVERLCTADPDRTASCLYVDRDLQPHCVVGVAWANLGVHPEDLAELCITVDGRYLEEEYHSFEHPHPDVVFVRWVQSFQDEGHTWGEALEATREQLLAST